MPKQSGGGIFFIGLILIIGFSTIIFSMPKGESTGGVVGTIQNALFGGDEVGEEGLLSSKRDVIVCEISIINQYGVETKIIKKECRVLENECTNSVTQRLGMLNVLPSIADAGYIMMIIGDEEKRIIEYDITESFKADQETFSTDFCYKPERLDRYEILLKNYSNKDEFLNEKTAFAEVDVR